MSLEDAANAATLLGIFLAIIGAFFAYRQLRAGTAASESASVLALDEAFARFEDLRRKINTRQPFSSQEDRVELRRYLAVWERLGLLVENRTVDLKLVNELYGSRFEALLKRDEPREIVKGSPEGWRNFILLWQRFHEEGLRKFEEHPPAIPRRS